MLRSLIKEEALKQFDKDNDVLFQMVADKQLSDNETVYSKISKYAASEIKFKQAIEVLPLLTIMVPELPSLDPGVLSFSPKEWNTTTQIPLVAIDPSANFSETKIYNAEEEVISIPYGSVPIFPVVVIKENERLTVKINGVDKSPKSSILLKSSEPVSQVFSKGGLVFSFSNEAFNGLPNSKNNTGYTISREIPASSTIDQFDPRVIDAYTLGIDWHRDYVYYGLNPAAGVERGKFDNNYMEYIKSIKMITDDLRFSDQDDPTPTQAGWNSQYGTRPQEWTDGYFDIRISVLINAKNGIGELVTKAISASGSDLFDIKYVTAGTVVGYLNYDGIIPKEFHVNVPIVAWNLETYGAGWKFIVSEYDLSEETTTSITQSSEFNTNFSFDPSFGTVVKVGVKFGASAKFTQSSSFVYKSTQTSDGLGEGTLEFGSPIIIIRETVKKNPDGSRPYMVDQYRSFDVNTGFMLIAVEPRRLGT